MGIPRSVAQTLTVFTCLSTPPVSLAACFDHEYPARIEHEYSYDILSPMPGFVAWPPREGVYYDRIDLKRPIRGPLRYIIAQDQTSDVVAWVTNEALWAREQLADLEESGAFNASTRGKTMSNWQSHMREHEDFLFALQQNKNIPVPRKNEEPAKRSNRAYLFAGQSTSFTWGNDPEWTKEHSVNTRYQYSDYMRAFELPQFLDNLSLAYRSAAFRARIVRGERQLGMLTCPERCTVVRSYVREGQRVNEGDKIATVVSPFHKKITIDLDRKHVLNFIETSDHQVAISFTRHDPRYRIYSFAEIPEADNEPIPTLTGHLLGPPVLSADGTKSTIQFSVRDESGDAERRLNILSADVRVRIVPEEYVAADANGRTGMESKIKALGLSCE